ncbi:hypothetical protein QVN42_03435 [Yersinia nurmii]|uniref:Uncharacterized protein n=1 Tax=Yersinia nurmii TaxID=685706 RepID=A0AAW7JXP1_9GAMM|nr:hypothetical protein [Yersinia nurmii]MDN0086456.1 hypothetical protein [Yersinia nurmii]
MAQKNRGNHLSLKQDYLLRLAGIAIYALPFEAVNISGLTKCISKITGNHLVIRKMSTFFIFPAIELLAMNAGGN